MLGNFSLRDLFDQIRHGALRSHAAFEQRIARQTIRPVQAGATHLAHSAKPPDTRGPIHIGEHATALIMSRWHHGNGFFGDVDADIEASFLNVRKVTGNELWGPVADVEIDAGATGLLDLMVDRPCHDVTRCQRATRIIPLHELLPVFADQACAFSPEGLADEEGAFLRMVEAGRMELDEFHVRYGGTSAPSHRHTVTCRDAWIGGVQIDPAAAARGENDAIRAEGVYFAAGLIEHIKSEHTVLGNEAELGRRQDVDGVMVFVDRDVRAGTHGSEQFLRDLPPSGICCMQHTTGGMPTFPRQIKFQVAVHRLALIKMHAPLHQIGDARRTFAHDGAHRRLFAQASPGDEGVAHMLLNGVVFRCHASDAALSPVRIRVQRAALRDHHHFAMLSGMQCCDQSACPGPDDDEVCLYHEFG